MRCAYIRLSHRAGSSTGTRRRSRVELGRHQRTQKRPPLQQLAPLADALDDIEAGSTSSSPGRKTSRFCDRTDSRGIRLLR